MAPDSRKVGIKRVALSVVKDDLSRYLREAETGEILITRRQACRNLDRLCLRG
jgi:hypothetical protein